MNFSFVRVVSSSMLVVLITFSVCIVVNAYDANCKGEYKASTDTIILWSSMNAYGLENGTFNLHVKLIAPGTTVADSFDDGSNLWRSIGAAASGSNTGYANAWVSVHDTGNDNYCYDHDSVN